MNFAGGLSVQASSTYGSVMSSFISVQGTKGWAMLMPAYPFDRDRFLTVSAGSRTFTRRFKAMDEFAPELDAFSAAIQSGQTVEPDGRQGHRDLQIIHAIYESAHSQKELAVRYDQ
jgi:predicted dehydrogenase